MMADDAWAENHFLDRIRRSSPRAIATSSQRSVETENAVRRFFIIKPHPESVCRWMPRKKSRIFGAAPLRSANAQKKNPRICSSNSSHGELIGMRTIDLLSSGPHTGYRL